MNHLKEIKKIFQRKLSTEIFRQIYRQIVSEKSLSIFARKIRYNVEVVFQNFMKGMYRKCPVKIITILSPIKFIL